MLKGNKELYGFGPFRLDVSEHRLEREDGGEVAYLPEKAFQTLVVLVRNAGSLVTKEQLLNEVWPDTIVEENNLDKCIYTIRHSLGDSPSQHQFIETVRKHGYRFIADVRTNDHCNDEAEIDAGPATDSKADAGILGASRLDSITAREVRFRNAFEICQQARIKYQQMTAPTTLEARELVNEALRIEPDLPIAHSLSAELTTLEVIVGLKWPDEGFAEARASIARAHELGGESAESESSAAYVDLIADWDFAGAERKLREALEMNEHHGPANRMLTEVLMFQGRHDEAAEYIKRAQVETGLHNANIQAISRFLAHDYPGVINVCEDMLTLSPGHMIPAWTKCWAFEQMGRADEAISGYEKILRLPDGKPALRWIGYAYAAAGDRENALETAARLEAALQEHNLSPTHLAAIYARIGEIDKAVQYIDMGLEMRDPFMLWVPTDPRFDELRGHDRFKEIMDGVLEKAKVRKAIDVSRRPKEIRIVPSVQDTGHELQNEPTISTATTQSGAFVISAKWRPPGSLQPQPLATKERSSAARIIAVVALLAVIGVGAALAFYYFATGVKVFESRSIAILPFKPIDSTNRDEIYEVGIADSLIHRMGGLENLVVRPIGATRKYADLQQDPVAAGREQKVDYVLSANYQLSDGKIRVTAQLINVATGQVEETLKSESGISDVFAMQDAIADQIAKVLLMRFASISGTQRVWRGTANEEAYRLYLQGMYLYSKRTLAASKTAVELFDRAVQVDPKYALAWAGKAHAHRYAGNLGRDTDTHGEYRRSIDAINTALSLNKDLSEAHSALCENKYYYEFDFAGAEAECKRAIALDPGSSLAHEIYGRFLYHRGRFSDGILEINRAVDLEPASLFNQRNLGIAYYYSGRYEEAEAQLKRVIAMDQTFASAYMWLRNSLEMQQKHAEAYEWFIKAQKIIGTDESIVRRYQTAYAESGYSGMMREHARFADTYNQYYIGGILNAQIGDKDRAFEYLENSYQRREWGMNSLLIEPQLEPLRSDPRFKDLVAKVGLN